MATSLHKAQFALKLCSDHTNKDLHAYCKSCTKKICSSCIKKEHNSHDWEMVTDMMREKRRTLPEECKEIRNKQLPGLRKEIDHFKRKIEEVETKLEQNKFILNDSRQSYIDKINQIFDDRIDECQQKSEAARQIYKAKHDGLKQKVEYLEMMTTSLDKDIDTLPDHDILDMEKEMREELEKALSYSANKYTCSTVFVPGQMDIQALYNMIGEIHSMSVEDINNIDGQPNAVMSVEPISDANAWIRIKEETYFKLFHKSGDELKSMKTVCTDLVSIGGKLILTNYNRCIISVLTQDEDKIGTFDTKPLQPTYLSKTENDDILVSLRDGGDQYNLVPTSRRIVQRMTLTGKVLHTYEFREDGKTRLFTLPTRTAENKNTDICVVNRRSESTSSELVVLHKDGSMKFTFNGNGQEFLLQDVKCDSKCRIVLTEAHSRSIQMLSADGIYLCQLCHYENLRPRTISFQ